MAEQATEADHTLREPSRRAILAIVGFGVFVAADDLTVVTTMLRPIIGDLGIVLPDGLDDAAWIVNAYLIAFVAVMPFMGRLSDVIGRRRVYMAAFTLFLAGSIIIPLSNTFGPFLFGRVLTALGGGAMVPIGMAVVADVYPEGKRAKALGILGGIETLGWVWGPLYGAMLVRFLSWRWQFYLNIPLALIGIAGAWWALRAFDRPSSRNRVDWVGAATLTVTLVALNLALLGAAEIQSVSGLDELTGATNFEFRWLYIVAVIAGVWFWRSQRSSDDPLIDFTLFRGRNLTTAVVINFLVGAALVIAMVDVPLFVNVVELDIERSAVISGWVLSALTAAMAVSSYVGGQITERTWYRPPVVAGLAGATVAFVLMGFMWDVETAYTTMAWQLGILGFGLGLVTAPTSAAVVDAAPPDRRGTAASLVVVLRLVGLSVGLSGLTAYGLWRFNELRPTLQLPPLDDPSYQEAVTAAQAELTTSALAETFVAAAVLAAIAFGITFLMRRRDPPDLDTTQPMPTTKPRSAPDQGAAMTNPDSNFITRNAAAIVGGLIAVTLLSLVISLVMLARVNTTDSQLDSVQTELVETRAEMEQLRGGVALFSSQATLLQSQLGELAPTVTAGLDEAVAGLTEFENSTITFNVPINETIPINTEVVLDRVLQVPISTVLPIDETIDTTIIVQGPFGIDIPLDITVPILLDLPVDLEVAIPINETVPINTTIPVNLSVPIEVHVEGSELATLASSLRRGLISLRDVLAGLG
ncbi:MAG: MFS transporter [Acidimicrobiia bacterium]|nr:MFS transporter [Acidimicrobiia bacterium]